MVSFPRLLMALALASLLSISATAQLSLSDSPPAELLAAAGTVLAVQVRDHISSDKTTVGDSFVGVLQQPLVIDGWIVSRPGQTVMGQITSANSAGRRERDRGSRDRTDRNRSGQRVSGTHSHTTVHNARPGFPQRGRRHHPRGLQDSAQPLEQPQAGVRAL
jgi:hypothetical protein